MGHKRPNGALYHAEGPTENGGWWAISAWETDDDARRFDDAYLHPVMKELGIPIPTQERLDIEWETSTMAGQSA